MDSSARFHVSPACRRTESLIKINAASRKLFLTRGYHGTRPQDITREAKLGHGTFYLHYKNKQDCFFAFVDDARAEFCAFMRARVARCGTVEQMVTSTLETVYDFSDQNPGLLNAVMTDDTLFDAGGVHPPTTVQNWAAEWALMIRDVVYDNDNFPVYEPTIVGLAVLGAINHCRLQSDRMDVSREQVITILTQLLTRALTAKTD